MRDLLPGLSTLNGRSQRRKHVSNASLSLKWTNNLTYMNNNIAENDSATNREYLLSPAIDQKSSKSFPTSRKIDAKELKEQLSFAKILENDGHDVQRRGKLLACCCPFHDERTPSFFLWEDDKGGKCYGCGWYGDLYAYTMEEHKLDFRGAMKRLQKKVEKIKVTGTSKRSPNKIVKDEGLTPAQHQEMRNASQRLADHSWVIEKRIAKRRAWRPETILKLAEDGSLGWYDDALGFHYSTGLKLRHWPEKVIRWEYGHSSIWRGHLIAPAQTVYICEGETDAISFIEMGFETLPDSVVVALPSASTIPSNLVALLTGKAVVLAMDWDRAGDTATDKLFELLEPVCASISFVNRKEVSHE